MLIELKKLNTLLLATIILTLAASVVCRASSNEYSLARVLNVALLRIPSAGQSGAGPTGALLSPYIFDILSHRPDVMPSLWHLQNPLAPPTVDSVNVRFGGIYTAGQALAPNMAPYWEVDFSQINTADQLAEFDLLVIRTDGLISLTLTQRQILRQYVDRGGTLWIDGNGAQSPSPLMGTNITATTLDQTNIFRVLYGSSSAAALSTSYHPVANSPYAFSSTALANLGYGAVNSPTIVDGPNTALEPDITMFQELGGSLIAGDYGSGHVIIDGLGIGDAINVETTGDSNMPSVNHQYDETNYNGSATSDLQFLVNVLSYATSSSSSNGNPRGTNTQGGNLNGVLTPTWVSTLPAGDSPVGMAAYGKFVYTTDTAGTLSCFDINPPESIFPNSINGDDGVQDFVGSSHDLIWSATPSSGALSSPVVANIPIAGVNTEVVMVEDATGTVTVYPATYDPNTGVPGSYTFTAQSPALTLSSSGGTPFTGTVPAPTYYRGQILAPQPDGSLRIYNVVSGSYSSTSGSDYYNLTLGSVLIQSPLVASVPSTDGTYKGDEIAAYAVSGSGVQSIELGSRDETLNYVTTNTGTQFSTHAGASLTVSGLIGPPEDTNSSTSDGSWILDFSAGAGAVFTPVTASPSPATNPSGITVSGASDLELYADYNNQMTTAVPARSTVPAALADASGAATIVGASVGPDDTLYVSANETPGTAPQQTGSGYIESVHDQNQDKPNSSILWRFELNGTSASPVLDASGIQFGFYGFQFVGAPVVSNAGVVYALAEKSGDAVLMAFNTRPQIGFGSPYGNDRISVSQTDEFGNPEEIDPSQYVSGLLMTDFSPSKANSLPPSAYAPGVFYITDYKTQSNDPSGPPVAVALNTAFNNTEPLLEWFTDLGNVTINSPPKLIGNYIYFGATPASGTAETIAVLANPQSVGLEPNPVTRAIPAPGSGSPSDYRFVESMAQPVGAVITAPVASDKYLIEATTGGFVGYAYDPILVADSNRLIELDPDGNATWTMDSTQQSTGSIAANSTGTPAYVSVGATTSVPLNRPSTVTQLNANDYLIADSGNNRCVHADRSGNVLTEITDPYGYVLSPSSGGISRALEISSFSDPLGLLPTGDPLTLNEPNSVVTWLTYEYASWTPGSGTPAPAPSFINAHYLIADTGNKRIVDIVDRYTEVGTTSNYTINTSYPADFHYLNWISHTSDIGGRRYKYVSAEPLLNNSQQTPTAVEYPSAALPTTVYPDSAVLPATVVNSAEAIIGVVGDKYIPALSNATATNLTATNGDTAGSSILLLYYTNGQPYSATSGTYGYQSGLPFDLINSLASGPSTAPNFHKLKGLRSAVATSYSLSPPLLGTFTVADDDGVFDGTQTTAATTNISSTSYPYLLDATYGALSLGWSFASTDYSTMTTTYGNLSYENTPFVPASAIELPGNNYLITNRGAFGNPNGNSTTNTFGGDVFMVHADVSSTASSTILDGPIYGSPQNTGALVAPAFALGAN